MKQNGKGIGCIGILFIFVIIALAVAYWWIALIILAAVIIIVVAVRSDKKKKQAEIQTQVAAREKADRQEQRLNHLNEDGLKGYMADCLRLTGYTEICVVPKSLSGGVDITGVTPRGRKCIFRCVKENAALDVPAVRETASVKTSQGADEAGIFSCAGFTAEACRYAAETGIVLYDGSGIERLAASAASYGLS